MAGKKPKMPGRESRRTLGRGRAGVSFTAAWPDRGIVQGVIAQLPCRQIIPPFERLHGPDTPPWYAGPALRNGCYLPQNLKGQLPTVEQIEAELAPPPKAQGKKRKPGKKGTG